MSSTPTATRAQLGRELRALRQRAGMNTTQAATLLRLKDASTYRRYESGTVTIPYPSLDLLLRAWGITGEEERRILVELREQSDQPVWWSEYRLTESTSRLVGFEEMATRIRAFELAFIYGPLQTEDYARAVLAGTNEPGTGAERIEHDLRLRMERQARTFTRNRMPPVFVLLDESVLRRNIGGPAVMRAQLATLANVRSPWELRVLPLRADAHPGLMGAFWLFDFDPSVRQPAVYMEGPRRNLYLDDQASVRRASVDFGNLWAAALREADSRELILTVMEEWKR